MSEERSCPKYLAWSACSHVGRVRKNNEDKFIALNFNAQEFSYLGKYGQDSFAERDFVFAVSDGMGGAKAGEFASKIAVEKLTKYLPKSYLSSASGMETGFGDLFEEIFAETHRSLTYLSSQYEECAGMGSTMSLAWFRPGWMYFAHIGDSRIYYFPAAKGELKQVTKDDTHVGWLLRNGKINEREARSHPMKHSIQKALGAGHQFVDPQVGAVGLEAGDRFLICSDGIVDGLWDRNIIQILQEPYGEERKKNAADRLVEAAVERSGRDNTTAVVIEICAEAGGGEVHQAPE
ncbi:MAG: PP2C family protein-serine/threonine phosphatase [Chthoniobacterales bacterium]